MGPPERNIGDVQGRGSADQGQGVGVVFSIDRQDRRNKLGLTGKALGEERPDGPVDNPRGEDFPLCRTPFPLEKSAGNFSRGIGAFLVVDGQGEKIDPLTRGV